MGSIPESGRSLGGGNGNPLQYSCLENPMDKGAWQASVYTVSKSQTWVKRCSTCKNRGAVLASTHSISMATHKQEGYLQCGGPPWGARDPHPTIGYHVQRICTGKTSPLRSGFKNSQGSGSLLKGAQRDFLHGPEVNNSELPMQGARVPSLIRELRSCMSVDMDKK